MDADNGEARLYCHSPAREHRAIDDAKSAGFEASLEKIAAALGQPAGTKTMGEVMQKIGRARQRYARAAQHYKVHAVADHSGQQVTAVTWECFS